MRALRSEGGRLLLLCATLLGLGALALGPSCASTSAGQGEDLATPPDGRADGGDEPTGCFMGTPQTEADLLNRCTDAERIERAGHVPKELWDGKAPLPQPPL